MSVYGAPPEQIAEVPNFDLVEFMHYLYLPIKMPGIDQIRMPENLFRAPGVTDLVHECVKREGGIEGLEGKYVYLTARCGYATPDNPLNRPGWHCDGFGTEDINYVLWTEYGTRFCMQPFPGVSPDHLESMGQFEGQVRDENIEDGLPERTLYRLTPYVVHATPLIPPPGCMRQFLKISVSPNKYNLLGNSHNYLFDYDWKMWPRDQARNDTTYAERDYFPEGWDGASAL